MLTADPVDERSDRPFYKQIADGLRDEIDRGHLRPGAKLPSETELIGHFGAKRATVRRALALLRTEGRVDAVRGVGVFVRDATPRKFVYNSSQDRFRRRYREGGVSPLEVEAGQQGFTYDSVVYRRDELGATPQVAEALGIEPGQRVFRRRRLVSLGPEGAETNDLDPVQLADSYFPVEVADAAPAIRREDTGGGGSHARLGEAGFALTHLEERVVFRMPSPREARELQLRDGVPVIDMVRVTFARRTTPEDDDEDASSGSIAATPASPPSSGTGDPQPIECFVGVLAGDRYRLRYETDLD